jgi:hypothetical protein
MLFWEPEDREKLLKRYFNHILIFTGVGVATLIIFVLCFRRFVDAHGVWVVMIFSGSLIAIALFDRSKRRRLGISDKEFQSYIYRQPIMIGVLVIMAISVVVHIFQVIFPK